MLCDQPEVHWADISTHALPPHGGFDKWAHPMQLSTAPLSLLLLYNTLGQPRNETLAFVAAGMRVPAVRFLELGNNDAELDVQVQPVLSQQARAMLSTDSWQVLVRVCVPAAGWTLLLVDRSAAAQNSKHTHFAQVQLYGSTSAAAQTKLLEAGYRAEQVQLGGTRNESLVSVRTRSGMELHCERTTGLLSGVTWGAAGVSTARMQQHLLHYSTGSSGAYIFDPTGPAEKLPAQSVGVVAVSGPLYAAVHTHLPAPFKWQTLALHADEPWVDHVMQICLTNQYNSDEFGVRFTTDLQHNQTLWTDVNGWPTVTHARTRFADPQTGALSTELPLAANFHPMIAFAALEDKSRDIRLTMLTRTSSAVATLAEGELEVLIDRQTHNDDGRGLGESLMDSECFERALRLHVAPISTAHTHTPTLSHRLQYPVVVASSGEIPKQPTEPHAPFSLLAKPNGLPAEVHVLSMRPCLSTPTEVCMQLQHTSSSDTPTPLPIGKLFSVATWTDNLMCARTSWEALSNTSAETALARQPLRTCELDPLHPLDIVTVRLSSIEPKTLPATTTPITMSVTQESTAPATHTRTRTSTQPATETSAADIHIRHQQQRTLAPATTTFAESRSLVGLLLLQAAVVCSLLGVLAVVMCRPRWFSRQQASAVPSGARSATRLDRIV